MNRASPAESKHDERGAPSRPSALRPANHPCLFLHERALPDRSQLPAGALAAAAQRADRWRRATGLDDAGFGQRLAFAGLDWDGFVGVLAMREAAREAAQPPGATEPSACTSDEVLEEIRLGTHADVTLHSVRWRNPDGTLGTEPPFASFLRPFVQCGLARLRRGLAELDERLGGAEPLIETSAEIQFALALNETLTKRCSSTLILELNVARLRGLLEGATPTDRFRYFSERYFTPAKVLQLLEEYPVLARLMSLAVRQWADATLEFLSRLGADRERLGAILTAPGQAVGASLGTLRAVELGVSDPHRGGRSVVIAEDVHGHRVVYKPTSLAVDAHLQRVVHVVNGLGLRYPLRPLPLVDRGEYGWLQFVATRPCGSIDELHRFYWRQGCWIALLHLLRGADFHHENLIACGEYPVLLDNETLLQHSTPRAASATPGQDEADRTMARSVVRQALLPFVQRLTATGGGMDGSGLGGGGGQVVRGGARRWAEPGTDRMRVIEADVVSQEARNRPTLGGEPVNAVDYLADIVAGFRETYALLATHKATLRPWLDGFAGTTVRHLLRPTRAYTVFLREGYHPNDLGDGLDRDELLDRLWGLATWQPALLRAIPCEHEDLRLGDIPVFFSRADSTHLWSSGGRRLDDFFAQSSLDEAHQELAGLSESDRERQVLLIRLAVSEAQSRSLGPSQGGADRSVSEGTHDHASPADLHAAAVRVGELLKRRAIIGKHGVHWITLEPFVGDRPGEDKPRNIALAGTDLYHGAAGLALFFAYLGKVSGVEEYADLARGTLRAMLETPAHSGAATPQALGPYLGKASRAYVLLHLAALWAEPDLLAQAIADLPHIEALIPVDDELDILGGSAGCLLVMLQLHAATGDPAALRTARACGDHLLRTAQPGAGGVGWSGRSFGRPVPGLAHGVAGIAWALLELAAATGDERYRQAAVAGLAFERSLLSAPDNGAFHARVSWCHGLPSVALARVVSAALIDDPLFTHEIQAGVERILTAEVPADACLCHGQLGNAEILAMSARHCGVDDWQRHARAGLARAATAVEALEREVLLPLHARFAGLFCGLAGVGWGLLRGAHGDAIPSVLTLQPPRSENAGTGSPSGRTDSDGGR